MTLTFKLGWILLKTELSKHPSAAVLRDLEGQAEERILLQKVGKYYNQLRRFDRPDGLVVVTNHRLVFLSALKTILTTTDYLSFPLEMIEDLKTTKVWKLIPAISFRVEGVIYIFTFLSSAGKLVEAARLAKHALHSAG